MPLMRQAQPKGHALDKTNVRLCSSQSMLEHQSLLGVYPLASKSALMFLRMRLVTDLT